MRCLVLGGTGWVGHHIALAMHAAGHAVTIASRGKAGGHGQDLPGDIQRLIGDKTVADDLDRLLAGGFDAVFDSLPAMASIRHLLDPRAPRNRFGHYIHCSSTGGYAPLPYCPGDEDMPYDHFMGGWAYKNEVDTLALTLGRENGIDVTVIRPTYITGEGLLPIDNFGGRREDFLPDLLAGRPIILPNDGQALLHPVHVADLAQGFRLAAERRDKSRGQVYIVTGPHAITLTDYIHFNAKALNVEPVIRYMPIDEMLKIAPTDTSERGLRFLATHMCFTIAKARRDLGYEPRYTAQAAVEATARWGVAELKVQG